MAIKKKATNKTATSRGWGCALLAVAACGCAQRTDWSTRAERTNFVETSRYDETVAYCRDLAANSPWVRVVSIGTTPEGRDMPLVVLARDGAFSPEAARRSGRAIVLVVNGVHSGEIEGKDASLALMRDIVVTRRREKLLDHVVLLVVPIFNIDGHERFGPYHRINQNGPKEMGWRTTARNLNLNRDYMKADCAEMRHLLRAYHAWRPQLWFDTHTTDGADFQYDITFMASEGPEFSEGPRAWVSSRLHPHLLALLEADGFVPQLFFEMRDRLDPAKGIDTGSSQFAPRFSTGYGAISNRPCILVETHMLKPYEKRVRATYALLVRTLELINADPRSLMAAVEEADREAAGLGNRHGRVVLTTSQPAGDEGEPIVFRGYEHRMEKSAASGGEYPVWDRSRPIEVPSRIFSRAVEAKSVEAPAAYLVPRAWTEVIDLLELHGQHIERLKKSLTIEVDSYRFSDVRWAERSFEGRHVARFQVQPIREVRTYGVGSALVYLDTPMSRVAVHLLEPEAPDSLVQWGFFDAIFEQKEYSEDYAMSPIADRLLAGHEDLRREFESWLRREPKPEPRERLAWFYRHSPFHDLRKDVYPVGKLRELPKPDRP